MSSDHKPDDEEAGQFASPPCFMHEIDPTYSGLAPDQAQARDVARWRKTERERLIAARLAKSAEERNEAAGLIARDLNTIVPETPSTVISLYWPFRGEPDLRPWMAAAYARGLRVALPIVVAKAQPLEFREWTLEARMERGVWNIPFPAEGAVVVPTVV
ncbi:MAG: 5-formyltetrahydrofolate cyclo-ligase, partial [Proteobacteria bacterium]|nr:5-formyltetrahydrofolate cyclo-ligase [Pseudomonadota bacterium]